MVSLPNRRYIRWIVPSSRRTCHELVISPTNLASDSTAEAGCNCYDQGVFQFKQLVGSQYPQPRFHASLGVLPLLPYGYKSMQWLFFPLPRKRGKSENLLHTAKRHCE